MIDCNAKSEDDNLKIDKLSIQQDLNMNNALNSYMPTHQENFYGKVIKTKMIYYLLI